MRWTLLNKRKHEPGKTKIHSNQAMKTIALLAVVLMPSYTISSARADG